MSNSDIDKIAAFIRKHHVMTLATVGAGGRPWTAHVFYAWLPGENLFVFTTEPHTRHGAEISACADVAAGIALETSVIGRLQGLQIEGRVCKVGVGTDSPPCEGGVSRSDGVVAFEKARRAYLKRFPYAAVADLSLWALEPFLMKLTDNTLGFGKKLIWQK